MPGVLCSQVCGLFGAGHTFCALYRRFENDAWATLSLIRPIRRAPRTSTGDDLGRYAFRPWSFDFVARPGRNTMMVNAVNKIGQTQTAAVEELYCQRASVLRLKVL